MSDIPPQTTPRGQPPSLALTHEQRSQVLHDLPAWRLHLDGRAIARDLRFADFSAAWGFMARVALLAERMDHHPDWTNSYGRVELVLTSHDAGGLTMRDARMAQGIDRILADMNFTAA